MKASAEKYGTSRALNKPKILKTKQIETKNPRKHEYFSHDLSGDQFCERNGMVFNDNVLNNPCFELNFYELKRSRAP